ncbi:MAG: response regulator [Polyangiaceae bacterium]|nr:response regulator [Polyangiaceae bacterium]
MGNKDADGGNAASEVMPNPNSQPVVSAIRPRAVPATPCVLVVDDDLLVRSMTQRALERLGFAVVAADCGDTALTVFRELARTIDLVLLDRTMPGMSGEETFARLREIDPGVRVVYASGAAPESDGAGLPAGISGFVQKPCLPSQLAALLRRVLGDEARG